MGCYIMAIVHSFWPLTSTLNFTKTEHILAIVYSFWPLSITLNLRRLILLGMEVRMSELVEEWTVRHNDADGPPANSKFYLETLLVLVVLQRRTEDCPL